MKIYTKSGDDGTTALVGGKRIPKTDLRIDAYGTVDELNSIIGVAIEWVKSPKISALLISLQSKLFDVGSDLACELDGKFQVRRIDKTDISALELHIDAFDENLDPLKNFILPGGSKGSAFLHQCRTVCRRAERMAIHCQEAGIEINDKVIPYLNRLSDLFFILARAENAHLSVKDVIWVSN